MKTALSSILMLLVCAAGAQARLGETVDEINHRYGAPIALFHEEGISKAAKIDGVTIQTNSYYFKNINITVIFLDGKSAFEQYQSVDEYGSKVLLDDNAGKYQWREAQNAPAPGPMRAPSAPVSRHWELFDQANVYAIASWSNGSMVVMTAEYQKMQPDIGKYYEQERKAKEEQTEREKLDGF